ncbi:MAG TPA: hypothetical protein VEZ46_01580, partial [Mycobacteriales bacterium]|nr:hypothetical protein [Mycobacteriales bacterium]
MSLPTLDPEIADLGLAIGLLNRSSGGGVELDSDWFSDPGPRITGALADSGRRTALVRFVESVLGDGEHVERDGVVYLRLFNLRELVNDNALPDLTVQASLDARPADYVEVGLAVSLRVEAPAVVTELAVPLYRAKKAGRTVAQEFALLDGGVVRVSTDLTLSTAQVAVGDFGLAGVAVSLATPLDGSAAPSFRLVLKDLHLPGAATSDDIDVGGPGVPIEDSLLSLVLGLVRQSAAALTGPAAAQVGAVLDLLGLGDAATIPPLPVADVLERGADAVRDWFTDLVSTPAALTAWLTSLAELFPGSSVAGGDVSVPISGGPVSVQVGFRSATGSGGHPQVTPRIGVQFTTDVAGGVRLGGRVAVDLFTIDVGTGTLTPLPYADVAVTARGSGSGDAGKLLNTGPVDIGELRVGLSIRDGAPRALLELHDVDVDGSHQDVLDLSSPQAVGAAAGQLAGNLLRTALDGLGDAGDHLKALLGLTAPAGGTEIDGAALLADPLAALAAWWRDLTAPPATGAVEVLGHLRSLLSGDAQVTQLVTGS